MSKMEYKWKEGEAVDEDDCLYDSYKDMFWTKVLRFCDCYSDNTLNTACDIFKQLYEAAKNNGNYHYNYEGKSEEYQGMQELILHTLDKEELTEHGSSIRGCWMDKKGIILGDKLFEAVK